MSEEKRPRWVQQQVVWAAGGAYFLGGDAGVHGYQPGRRVTVMPAEDAEEMLELLRSAAGECYDEDDCWECGFPAADHLPRCKTGLLLSRLRKP